MNLKFLMEMARLGANKEEIEDSVLSIFCREIKSSSIIEAFYNELYLSNQPSTKGILNPFKRRPYSSEKLTQAILKHEKDAHPWTEAHYSSLVCYLYTLSLLPQQKEALLSADGKELIENLEHLTYKKFRFYSAIKAIKSNLKGQTSYPVIDKKLYLPVLRYELLNCQNIISWFDALGIDSCSEESIIIYLNDLITNLEPYCLIPNIDSLKKFLKVYFLSHTTNISFFSLVKQDINNFIKEISFFKRGSGSFIETFFFNNTLTDFSAWGTLNNTENAPTLTFKGGAFHKIYPFNLNAVTLIDIYYGFVKSLKNFNNTMFEVEAKLLRIKLDESINESLAKLNILTSQNLDEFFKRKDSYMWMRRLAEVKFKSLDKNQVSNTIVFIKKINETFLKDNPVRIRFCDTKAVLGLLDTNELDGLIDIVDFLKLCGYNSVNQLPKELIEFLYVKYQKEIPDIVNNISKFFTEEDKELLAYKVVYIIHNDLT